MSSTDYNELPLPHGWIKQYNEEYGRSYYVDTKANPPRSIWTHPYEDEQYLREHPDAREKVQPSSNRVNESRRHSYNGESSTSKPKKGFFGKMKDKAIGTKEEREADKARVAQLQEQRRQQRIAEQQARQAYYAQQAQQNQYAQPQYGRPQYGGSYSDYGYGGGYGQGMTGMNGRRTGGNMALPLLGGLAGGLLLADVLDGGLGGGGFGGGWDNGGGGFF